MANCVAHQLLYAIYELYGTPTVNSIYKLYGMSTVTEFTKVNYHKFTIRSHMLE